MELTAYNRSENGERKFKLEEAYKLANILSMDIHEILESSGVHIERIENSSANILGSNSVIENNHQHVADATLLIEIKNLVEEYKKLALEKDNLIAQQQKMIDRLLYKN